MQIKRIDTGERRINTHHTFRAIGLTPSPLMSEIGGAGSELSKHWRHRDECLFIRHR